MTEIPTGEGKLYLATVIDLSRWSAEEIAAVAVTLNQRPRKVLRWRTPAEVYAEQLQSLPQSGVASTP